MSDESTRYQVKRDHYDGLTDGDRRLNVEGRLLDVLSKYGGKRVVAGKVVHDMVQELANEIYKMKSDGLI